MNRTNTAPAIEIALMSGIQTWMETNEDWELTHEGNSTIEEAVEAAAAEQTRIGWHELFKGRLSKKWGTTQQSWYDHI